MDDKTKYRREFYKREFELYSEKIVDDYTRSIKNIEAEYDRAIEFYKIEHGRATKYLYDHYQEMSDLFRATKETGPAREKLYDEVVRPAYLKWFEAAQAADKKLQMLKDMAAFARMYNRDLAIKEACKAAIEPLKGPVK